MLYNIIMYFCWSNEVSGEIYLGNRIITTIRKHVVPEEALASAAIGVGVEEALNNGVVISGLEVIEAGLYKILLPVTEKLLPFKNIQVI